MSVGRVERTLLSGVVPFSHSMPAPSLLLFKLGNLSPSQMSQKEQEMSSLAEERSKYTECLRSLHVTMEKELVDNKHAKYLAKLFNLKRGKKSKKV